MPEPSTLRIDVQRAFWSYVLRSTRGAMRERTEEDDYGPVFHLKVLPSVTRPPEVTRGDVTQLIDNESALMLAELRQLARRQIGGRRA